MRQREDVREVLLGDRDQEEVDARYLGRHQPAIAQQLAQHDVAHTEAERRKVDPAERLQETVEAAASTDCPEGAARVEQLEHRARVVRQPADDREVDVDPLGEPHVIQRAHGRPQRLSRGSSLRITNQFRFQLLQPADPGDLREIHWTRGSPAFYRLSAERLQFPLAHAFNLVDKLIRLTEHVLRYSTSQQQAGQ